MKLADVLLFLGADRSKLDSDLDAARGQTEGWAGKLGSSVKGMLTGVVVGGALAAAGAVVQIGTAAFDVSRETEKASASIAASLRVPADEAKRFAEVARQVYGNNFAGSVEEAGTAVTEVTKLLKLAADDPSLKTITEKALALKDSFGTEVSESVSTVKTLMDNFGISADEAFDLLTTGYQRGLDRSGDLVDSINEYSTQFANGGASAKQFFGTMEAGLAGGALGTDKAADAFKEFRVRILDGSKTTATALEQIGLSQEELTRQIDNGSMTIADAWNLVIGRLKETDDQSILMQAGVGLIGTQFEDLGQAAVLNMAMTNDAFASAAGATDSLNAKYATFGDASTAIWRRLVVSVSPLTDKLLELANAAIPYVMAAFEQFDSQVLPGLMRFGELVSSVVGMVMGLWGQLGSTVDEQGTGRFAYFKDWIDTNLPLVQTLVEMVLGAIQAFWESNGAAIMAIVDNVLSTITLVFDTGLKTILDLVTLALQLLTGDFEGASTTLWGIIDRLWATIKTIFSTALEQIRLLVTGINWGELGLNIITGIANGIRGAASFMADAAVEAARRAFDAAKEWLQIGSPSKRADVELGEPTGVGFGNGVKRKIGDVAKDITGSLQGMFGDVQVPALAGAAAAPAGGPNAGGMVFSITQNFYGPADEQAVERGAKSGIVAAMRQVGLR